MSMSDYFFFGHNFFCCSYGSWYCLFDLEKINKMVKTYQIKKHHKYCSFISLQLKHLLTHKKRKKKKLNICLNLFNIFYILAGCSCFYFSKIDIFWKVKSFLHLNTHIKSINKEKFITLKRKIMSIHLCFHFRLFFVNLYIYTHIINH